MTDSIELTEEMTGGNPFKRDTFIVSGQRIDGTPNWVSITPATTTLNGKKYYKATVWGDLSKEIKDIALIAVSHKNYDDAQQWAESFAFNNGGIEIKYPY